MNLVLRCILTTSLMEEMTMDLSDNERGKCHLLYTGVD